MILYREEKIRDIEEMIKKISEEGFKKKIDEISEIIVDCYRKGGKVIVFGNGGSAADAQHIAAEFVNRFEMNRKPLPAIALSTDTSIITSIGNDFSFDEIFEKQIECLARENDAVIAISTSGNSENVIRGIKKANEKKSITIGLSGRDGGKMKDCKKLILVPSNSTPVIQIGHSIIYHIVCGQVEKELFG